MSLRFARGQWRTVTLGDICETKTATVNPTKTPEQPFTYVDIASVDNQAKAIITPQELLGKDAPSRARKLIRASDVLVSMTRPNLNAVALVPPGLDGQVCSTGFCVLRAGPLALPEYLFHFVRSKVFVGHLSALVSGALYPAVTEGQVRDTPVPLPPLDEQRRIVDILNHAASIRRLRDEARAKAREIIPALFVEMFGDPATNPKGWPVSRLDAVVSFVSGATPSKQEPRYWIDGTPWVSAKDMKADPIVAAEDEVSDAAFAETNLKLIPAGSVLIVVRGMILAHTIPIRVNAVPVAINQDLKAMLPKLGMSEQFIRWCLQCLHNHLLAKISTAAHGTKKLEMDVLTVLPIPVPPLPLQQEFAERVAEVEGVCALNDRAATAAEQMVQSLLAQVFGPTG